MLEPGRRVIELRPPGTDKGLALTDLTAQRGARSVLFCGDDLGDLPAFAAVRALRSDGIPGLIVVSAAPESEVPPSEADLLADGPEGIATFLHALADALQLALTRRRPRRRPASGGALYHRSQPGLRRPAQRAGCLTGSSGPGGRGRR